MNKRAGRHRTREFARAVDGSSTPHPSVSRLVALANALRAAPLRSTSQEHSGLRARLMTAAATGAYVETTRSFWAEWFDRIRFQRGLASTTVLCTVLIAFVGVGFGTSKSLPGDTLYSMKLHGENVQLAFIGSDEGRGRKNLQFADSRLHEITRLVRHKGTWPTTQVADTSGTPDGGAVEKLINHAFTTMDSSTAAGAKAMRRAYDRTGETSPLAYLDRFTKRQQTTLRTMIPTLPSGSRKSGSTSLALVGELNRQTTEILSGSCASEEACPGDETTTAARPSTTPADPDSTSPSSTGASGTTSGGSTSSRPPGSSSGNPPTGGSGTDTGPSDGGGSSTGGSSPTTGSSTGESSTDSDDPTTPAPGGDGTPSATPPQPTGVPSSPSNSAPSESKTDRRTEQGPTDTASAGSGAGESGGGQSASG